ncbi:MAG: respiratory chain complex I subunit 1 family protein [Armatimonadota bacterium]
MSAAITIGLALLGGPLLAGVVRKHLRARVHSRGGPPVLQPFYDLLKLLVKEDLRSSPSPVVAYGPMVALAAALVAALATPMGTQPPLGQYADMIVFAYLITIAAVATAMVGLSSLSPFSVVGAGREIMLGIVVEPVMVICLVTAAVKAHSLVLWDMAQAGAVGGTPPSMIVAAIALLIAMQAQIGKQPFDIVEAETEVMGGPLVELSGPRLALFEWSAFVRQIVYASMLASIFIPWGIGYAFPWNLVAHLAKLAAIYALVGLVDVVNPRLRVEQAMRFLVLVIAVAVVGLGLALGGH